MQHDLPALDIDAIKNLRKIVKSINWTGRDRIPMAELLHLPAGLPAGAAMTVDVKASRELGSEMIVLRVPAHAPTGRSDGRLDSLSAREHEIASMVASGQSNKQIADNLFISLATVKTHVHHILKKTGCSNRAGIAGAYAAYSKSAV